LRGCWRQPLRSLHSNCMGCGIEPRKSDDNALCSVCRYYTTASLSASLAYCVPYLSARSALARFDVGGSLLKFGVVPFGYASKYHSDGGRTRECALTCQPLRSIFLIKADASAAPSVMNVRKRPSPCSIVIAETVSARAGAPLSPLRLRVVSGQAKYHRVIGEGGRSLTLVSLRPT
jgi:hypothetical protein